MHTGDFENEHGRAAAAEAVRTSSVPILCGPPKRVFAAAGRIFRAYGLTCYLLFPKNARPAGFFTRLFSAPNARVLPRGPSSPDLLADVAISFFSTLSATSIPVFVDCTDGEVFASDPVLRERLEPFCFLTAADGFRSSPPFSYLHGPAAEVPKGGTRR